MQRLTLSILTIVVFSFSSFFCVAQSEKSKFEVAKYNEDKSQIKIDWGDIVEMKGLENEEVEYLYFDGALYNAPISFLPEFSKRLTLSSSASDASVELVDPLYISATSEEEEVLKAINFNESSIQLNSEVGYYRKQPFLQVSFVPIRLNKNTGKYEKLLSFSFNVVESKQQSSYSRFSNLNYKLNSVLRSGTWLKIGVTQDGIYRINHAFLVASGLISGSVPSSSVRLFGNGGGMLPFANSEERIDDLAENAIRIDDGGDGSFDSGDYILFLGQSQHRWERNGSEFNHEYNFMADSSFYFITTNYTSGTPKRITSRPNINQTPDATITSFDDHIFHERNWTNFVKSGRNWYGNYFGIQTREHEFDFNFPNILTSEPVYVKYKAAARAVGRSSSMVLSVNGNSLSQLSFSGVSSSYISPYVDLQETSFTFNPTGNNHKLKLEYVSSSSSDEAWLDYVEVVAKRNLIQSGNSMFFRSRDAEGLNVVKYELRNATASLNIWDVTDPVNVQLQEYTLQGNQLSFTTDSTGLREYVSFLGNSFPAPALVGFVENQDLHSLPQADYIIVTHPNFIIQAKSLADFHRERGLTVNVVTTEQVYNEFSSGAQDITAIKGLMKMFYDRAGSSVEMMPKYLLLFGDASYDYKHVLDNNTNFVPAYQSDNSYIPTLSYISDDYFGFLDDEESDALNSILDIGVGRFPVKTITEAQNAVNKVFAYHKTPDVLGRWRNWVTYIGDDEDGNVHMSQANNLANKIETQHTEYNVRKIMFDAFPQESSFGGESYPDVNKAINDIMNRGTVLLTYVGHGGELGWAHERVLNISDINSWENYSTMPLFLTATCEFSRFDDPQRTSAGEFVFLNPRGGGIGMLTTTRLVYSSPNYELSQSFMDNVFDDVDGEVPTFGDLLRKVKDRTDLTGNKGINYRNFSLLGDPAIRLPVPEYDIILTDVPDTIKALDKITIKGYVANADSTINTSFNGELYPTVFDRKKSVTTLNNDAIGAFTFDDQTDVIFRGRSKVTNGEFEFSFVVPKDVSFEFGQSRISLYAQNGIIDAQGFYDEFNIGGTSSNVEEDNTPPTVEIWLNDSTFVRGGITNSEPILIANVFDENGINTVGNGIGHDIVAVLDENSSNAIVLNDYYESELDSYKRGKINYPFSTLADGQHTLTLKVWDVYNNSGSASTEFVVANDANIAIDHVLNYPNPFTTNTGFFFEHNAPGQELDVTIQIFSVSGKLVKILNNEIVSDGYRIGPISWDGRDEFGDKIGKGVYVYKVKVTSQLSGTTEQFEKLVILN